MEVSLRSFGLPFTLSVTLLVGPHHAVSDSGLDVVSHDLFTLRLQ